MSLTANVANVQIISDTASKTVARLTLFQATAGNESEVLKINVATLVGRTLILATNNVALGHDTFVPGEQLTQGAANVGYVMDWKQSTDAANGALQVVIANGAFTTGDVTGIRGGVANVVSVTVPTYLIEVTSVWYNISPGAVVALEYANATAKFAAATLCGQGYLGKNDLGTALKNVVPNTNGNLYVSTANVAANGTYTLVVELRKSKGYAGLPVY